MNNNQLTASLKTALKRVSLCTSLMFAAQASANVIINEVDVDQLGTDSAEFIELYDGGVGGTDLSGLSIVLYNGSSDTVYNAIDLDGLQTDSNGYFVVCANAATTPNCGFDASPDTNFIQNGADAVVLVNGDASNYPSGTSVSTVNVVDALVYDTNDSDDSGLLVLLNVGQPQVNEGGNGNKDTESNQRCANGSGGVLNTDTYQQFTPTPGAMNTCGGEPSVASVMINEVDADQTSTDDAEFIELYDGGAGNTDLSGLSVVLYNGSDDASYLAFDLDDYSTNEAGYFVICGNAANTPNCDLDVAPDTNLIQNGADAVAVVNGDATDYPNDTPVSAANVIDALVYDTNDSDDAGLLILLNPEQPQINEGGNGNKDTESNQRCGNGAGNLRDTDTYQQHAPTPGEKNTCGVEPNLEMVISEVDADQSGTDNAEFIELSDGGVGNTPLDGLSLVLYNGSDNASYLAFDLDGYTTNANGYFVLCGNAATTTNCDLDVAPDTNLIQNGADAVALVSGDAADYPNDTPVSIENLVDALVYDTNDSDDADLLVLLNAGQPQVNEDGAGNKDFESNQRCSVGALNTDSFVQATPTPGAENSCSTPIAGNFGQCADPATFIHEVQGSDFVSPLAGQANIVIEGVVIADYQDGLNGYYLQEEDAQRDDNAATSEGIFVADTATDVQVGDVVRVQGTPSESFGLTTLASVSNTAICGGDASVSESTFTMPVTSLAEFEALEGMLVASTNALTVNEHYNLARYGEMVLSANRTFQFTHQNVPNVEGYAAHIAQLELNQLILDDGQSNQNPDPLIYPAPGLSAENTIRSGYTTMAKGVMSYSFGNYRLQPTVTLDFIAENPRQEMPTDVGGNFKVASINVLNYFTTLDQDGALCGPSNIGCRGADSAEEFQRQRNKIIDAIVKIDADIIGLVELENNATESLSDLVNGLNAIAGEGVYSYLNTGTIGSDAIKVGFIYQTANAMPEGQFAILDSSVDPIFIDTKNRPVLAQTFTAVNGEKLTLAVNHFKSKGSDCDELGDSDLKRWTRQLCANPSKCSNRTSKLVSK